MKVQRMGTMTLLPPKPSACQKCAREHEPSYPHDQQSLYWHTWFKMQHGRSPTWDDALAHCDEEMYGQWKRGLAKHGVRLGKTEQTIACPGVE